MVKTRFAFLFLTLCIAFGATAQDLPVVKTKQGYIKGLNESGAAVFKGIPYAAPPVGQLRFMPPVDHAAWKDTLQTTQFGSMATQPAGSKVLGSEDCLYLNIYTPKTDNHKRAVVVWIHGGSMTNGAGSGKNGHAFADKDDIVAVTINYRLGVFGFLYMGDVNKSYAASGNNGVLDVVMALKWIRQNIAAFGGDPNRVTIMGESAGAKLLSAVMVAPASKGLFGQVIAESGSVQCIRDTVTAKNARTRILRQLGLGSNDAAKLLNLPAAAIIQAQGVVCSGIGGNSFLGPVYDGTTIPADAYQYVADKRLKHIRALIGTNEYEAAAFTGAADDYSHPDSTIFKPLFQDNHATVYTYYLQLLKTDPPYTAAVQTLTQYMYQMHSYRFAKVLDQNGIPVYMYRFEFANGRQFGASHGQELQYIWEENGLATSADTVKRQLAIDMHTAWVAFIKTGNPGIDSSHPWPNYKDAAGNTNHQVIEFDGSPNFAINPKWKQLNDIYNDKNFPSAVFVLK